MLGMLQAKKMVGAAGLELAASWSQTRRSSQLSYAPNIPIVWNYLCQC